MALEINEQTFAVSEDAKLKLSNIRGKVVIRAGENGSQIQVKATLDPESGDAERTQVEMHQEENGEVVVKTNYAEPFWGFLGRLQPCRVDYHVTVPVICRVHASTVTAELTVSGIQGKLNLSTVSGRLELTDAAGELSASTVSGNLAAYGLNGRLHLNSVSGSIQVEGQALETIDASTVSGSIRLTSDMNSGPYNFHSVSGNIHWQIPGSAACTIEMHTISGRPHVNLPVTRSQTTGGARTLWVQGGGTRISFNSVSGDFYLMGPEEQQAAAQPAEQSPVEQPQEASRQADVHAVLERIANGEITPEEGLAALRS